MIRINLINKIRIECTGIEYFWYPGDILIDPCALRGNMGYVRLSLIRITVEEDPSIAKIVSYHSDSQSQVVLHLSSAPKNSKGALEGANP